MFAGSDLIVACPHCAARHRLAIPEAAEVPGMITWTDGWQTAPGLSRPPRVTRCEACARSYWVGEAEQLGFLDRQNPAHAEWMKATLIEPLDAAGVQQALDEGLASFPELELELRVLLWWRNDDAFRTGDAAVGHSTDAVAIANMERVIEMAAEGPEDLLLFRAEMQRQLGRFAEMEATLEEVGCSDYWPAKSRLLELAKTGSRKLDVLFLPLGADEQPTAELS